MIQKFPIWLLPLLVVSMTFFTVSNLNFANGQLMQDISCPSCVTIPASELELYKELFPLIISGTYNFFYHFALFSAPPVLHLAHQQCAKISYPVAVL